MELPCDSLFLNYMGWHSETIIILCDIALVHIRDLKMQLARDKNCTEKCDKICTKNRLCKRAFKVMLSKIKNSQRKNFEENHPRTHVTRRQLLAQHCCAKNRRCESSRVFNLQR